MSALDELTAGFREVIREEARRAVAAAIATQESTEPVLVSVAKAAELLDVSDNTVRNLIDRGEVETVDGLGRGVKVTVDSVRSYAKRHASRSRLRSAS